MQSVNSDRIPNNVGLGSDKRLQRALESWQPSFSPVVARDGTERLSGRSRLPADRHRRRFRRLGPFRLRQDADYRWGHLPR